MESAVYENALNFVNFLNRSPTPFHVVESARQLLKDAGFLELKLSQHWNVKPLGKYFLTKNESTLIAFSVGGKYESGNGVSIVGAHTDSPCLKLKLVSKRTKCGFLQVGVECYGGGIWHTWFDRDLSIAGRVLVRQNDKIHHKLVHINKPILKIPNLAIHLNRDKKGSFSPNLENHLIPILATAIKENLLKDKKSEKKADKEEGSKKQVDKHHSILIDMICKELHCSSEDITDLELILCDHQPAVIGGALDEFIFGSRLDNQGGSYCSIKSLIESCEDESSLENETGIRMAAIYDHEEIGSESAQGAASALTEQVLRRIDPDNYELKISKSFLISADQAHALHPNYSDVHEENHKPSINGGIVLKYCGDQRYATNSISASVLREAAKIAKVPIQDYVFKNDNVRGSTIGPIMATKLGVSTVDIGMPQLAMHSIRETSSTLSITQYIDLLRSFYQNYQLIRNSYEVL